MRSLPFSPIPNKYVHAMSKSTSYYTIIVILATLTLTNLVKSQTFWLMVHDEVEVVSIEANNELKIPKAIIVKDNDSHAGASHWRDNITATIFWVGEDACKANPVHNHASSWDVKWMQSYGGVDCPVKRKGLHPVHFKPKMNPFYIALPYNDIASDGVSHKEEAPKVISWYHDEYKSKYKSVCKGKWLAIKHGDKICYAQWEDCGPFYTNDYEYVFLGKQPKKNRNSNAGIDLSPAVRDFLGVKSGEQVSWKFVDELDVTSGPWTKWLPYQGILTKYP